MSELRQDITTRDWVVFAADRAKRPDDFVRAATQETVPMRDDRCPFCPGNEGMTPPDLARVAAGASGTGWQVRVVPNLFPALGGASEGGPIATSDRFRSIPGTGAHEVVIETPQHQLSMADMSDEEITRVFDVYRHRYRILRGKPAVEAIVIFKNSGEQAGTSLKHPHSQIVASPVETPLMRRRREVAESYMADCNRCLYCDLRDWEREAGERVLFEQDGFVAIHPYASRWPFETWIMPLGHRASFGLVPDGELRLAALATRRLLRLLRAGLGDPPFNFVVHTALVREEAAGYFLWHIQVVPRLTIPAGFEMGSGMYINVTVPEQTAAFLRKLEES